VYKYDIIYIESEVRDVKRKKKSDKVALINLITATLNLIALIIRLLSEGK